MHPQPVQHSLFVLALLHDFGRHHHETLDDLGHLSQIEQVVALCRQWQQHLHCLFVERDGQFGEGCDLPLPGVGVLAVAPFEDLAEDAEQVLVAERRHVYQVEVPKQPFTRQSATATRQTHSGHELHIHDLQHFIRLQVVETPVVDRLAQYLNWRLGSVLLFGRHVQVVDEDQQTVAWHFRPVHTFLLLFHFGLEVVLHLESTRSC